jgi:hypothetical protein
MAFHVNLAEVERQIEEANAALTKLEANGGQLACYARLAKTMGSAFSRQMGIEINNATPGGDVRYAIACLVANIVGNFSSCRSEEYSEEWAADVGATMSLIINFVRQRVTAGGEPVASIEVKATPAGHS